LLDMVVNVLSPDLLMSGTLDHRASVQRQSVNRIVM